MIYGKNKTSYSLSIAVFTDGHEARSILLDAGKEMRCEGARVSTGTVLPFKFSELEIVGTPQTLSFIRLLFLSISDTKILMMMKKLIFILSETYN
jgi:hypothetical protein